MPDREETKRRKNISDKHFCYINSAFRFWGALTLVVLWALTIFTIQKPSYFKHVITWYLLVIAIIMTVFELLWVLNHSSCFRETGCCYCKCWKICMMVSNWKKGVLYIILAIPTFWIERDYLESIVVGIMLTISGVFYILMSLLPLFYREKVQTPEQIVLNPTPKIKVVSQEIATQTDGYSHMYEHSPAPLPPPKYTETDTVALPP